MYPTERKSLQEGLEPGTSRSAVQHFNYLATKQPLSTECNLAKSVLWSRYESERHFFCCKIYFTKWTPLLDSLVDRSDLVKVKGTYRYLLIIILLHHCM